MFTIITNHITWLLVTCPRGSFHVYGREREKIYMNQQHPTAVWKTCKMCGQLISSHVHFVEAQYNSNTNVTAESAKRETRWNKVHFKQFWHETYIFFLFKMKSCKILWFYVFCAVFLLSCSSVYNAADRGYAGKLWIFMGNSVSPYF